MQLAELAARTGLAVPTAHRLLRTLQSLGHVRQLESRAYALGPGLIGLGERATPRLAERARAALVRMEAAAQETANLAILDGDDVAYIAQVPSRHRMRMFTEVGRRVLPHASGVGRPCSRPCPRPGCAGCRRAPACRGTRRRRSRRWTRCSPTSARSSTGASPSTTASRRSGCAASRSRPRGAPARRALDLRARRPHDRRDRPRRRRRADPGARSLRRSGGLSALRCSAGIRRGLAGILEGVTSAPIRAIPTGDRAWLLAALTDALDGGTPVLPFPAARDRGAERPAAAAGERAARGHRARDPDLGIERSPEGRRALGVRAARQRRSGARAARRAGPVDRGAADPPDLGRADADQVIVGGSDPVFLRRPGGRPADPAAFLGDAADGGSTGRRYVSLVPVQFARLLELASRIPKPPIGCAPSMACSSAGRP